MSGPKVSNRRLRDVQRAAHLLGGLMLAFYVYLPLIGGPAPRVVEGLVQAVVFPLVVATGLLMWQLPRLRKRLRDRASAKASAKEARAARAPAARS